MRRRAQSPGPHGRQPDPEGKVLGTPGYMAPEQVRGRAVDARTDIFAFGVVLYEMLSGRRLSGRHGRDTQAAILTKDPDPLPPVTPATLDRVVRRCLEKRPEDRYLSAHELSSPWRWLPAFAPPRPGLLWRRCPRRPRWIQAATGNVRWRHRPRARPCGNRPLALEGQALQAGRSPSGPNHQGIAIFPLDDLSGNASEAYFAPGMTDALNTKLTQIKSIRVIGQASAARCKEEKMPLPKVAEVLGVDAVVQGSVLRVGDTVRISVRLLDAKTDSNLWAESYERKMTDVLMLQGQLAQAIASAVRAAVTPEEKEKLAGRPVDPRAYEEYLAGKYALDQSWGKQEIWRQPPTSRGPWRWTPSFAAAYDYLVGCYVQLWVGNYLSYEEAYPLAKGAALKAVELAPSEAASHDTLSYVMLSLRAGPARRRARGPDGHGAGRQRPGDPPDVR